MSEAPTIYPSIRYRDAPAAIQFLVQAFGFEEHAVHPDGSGGIAHAQMTFGPSMIMLGSERDDPPYGGRTGMTAVYVAVPDADAHLARARAAGAEIIREIEDQEYGSRDYAARDPEGNIWSFGTYRPSPADPAG